MSKIICDVCGTSYPDSATQCPICGCVRYGEAVTVSGDTSEAPVQTPSSHTYVKGGRFSKANVKKRNTGKPIYNSESTPKERREDRPSRNGSPKGKKKEIGLLAAVVVLLIVIAGVVIYIASTILGQDSPAETTGNTVNNTQQTENETKPAGEKKVEILSDTVILFEHAGDTDQIVIRVIPESSSDVVSFVSDNPNVAKVDNEGTVTAVGEGITLITITCGDATAECSVECSFKSTENTVEGTEPEQTTPDTTTPETTAPSTLYTKEDLAFIDNGFGYEYSIPLSQKSYNPYIGDIPADLVTFTSSNESVVTISKDGTVTFLKTGTVEVTAKYGEFEIVCIFRIY